jgi:hypothetical protein
MRQHGPSPRRNFLRARVVLRSFARRSERADAQRRVTAMLAMLDVVIGQLPEDVDDDTLADVERVVTTLRTADASIENDQITSGLQSLDLAQARLSRLAQRFAPDVT